MKKLFSLFIVCFAVIVGSAQIQVASTGNVAIGDTLTGNVKFFVRSNTSHETGIYSLIESIGVNAIAISGEANSAANMRAGVMGKATNRQTGRSMGVLGIAGNGTTGLNYGVFGGLEGNLYGAGIFGTTSANVFPQLRGRYAGYFYGDAHVTGTLTAGVVTTLSDARYKSNIQQINSTALAKIAALHPVQYTMLSGNAIALANTELTDTASTMTMITSNEHLSKANKIHYGLLAQEVKELYPELVYEDSAGVMSINYIELIPLLIQAVQDLSEQVSMLYSSSSAVRKQAPIQECNTESIAATLYQNAPNPFTEETVISYVVPTEAQQASIYIYNMIGEQIYKYDISAFGDGNVTISANELYVGTFLYSLVIDGKLIDTKQMIITQ